MEAGARTAAHIPRGVTKSSARPARRRDTDAMETVAEMLWSASTRGLLKFEDIVPMEGMPIGGVGVGPGTKGEQAFRAYTKHAVVIARLEAEGFVRSGAGAPQPWHMVKGNGIVSPADKAICRSLTPKQRDDIEAQRVAALKRRSQLRVQRDVAALHGELSDDMMIAPMGAATARSV